MMAGTAVFHRSVRIIAFSVMKRQRGPVVQIKRTLVILIGDNTAVRDKDIPVVDRSLLDIGVVPFQEQLVRLTGRSFIAVRHIHQVIASVRHADYIPHMRTGPCAAVHCAGDADAADQR